MRSARIGFVEARERLGQKQRSQLSASNSKTREEKNKKCFNLGKLIRSISPKIKNTSGYEFTSARIAYQLHLQGHARDRQSKEEPLKAGEVFTPQDPQMKKQVEEWLDTLQNGVKQNDDARSCKSAASLSSVGSRPSCTGTAHTA